LERHFQPDRQISAAPSSRCAAGIAGVVTIGLWRRRSGTLPPSVPSRKPTVVRWHCNVLIQRGEQSGERPRIAER
jgi:hypothetical protein